MTFSTFFRIISGKRLSTENKLSRKKFTDILTPLKSLANTTFANINDQEDDDDDNEAFNGVVGNIDVNNVKWINMDRNDQHWNSESDEQKPIQIVYDAARKPIGYIAEAPTPPPKTGNENPYIQTILNSINEKNIIRQAEKNQLIKVKRPNENISKPKRILIRRIIHKPVDMNANLLANSLGMPEVQETIIDPVKRTVTTISQYPPYSGNDIINTQLRSPFSPLSQFFSQYFPVIIHDPFQSYYESFSDLIEYGEDADICSKVKENVRRQGKDMSLKSESQEIDSSNENQEDNIKETGSEQHRTRNDQDHQTIVRRKRSTYAYYPFNVDKDKNHESRRMSDKSAMKFSKKKPFGHKISSAMNKIKENKESVDQYPFGTEGYSGTNISTLKVRRGGVAIAGPGGIATAGSGGTAILGPGQSAYSTVSVEGKNDRRSGGVAVVGPTHKIISVPSIEESHLLNLPPGAKLLTTGPIVYMNPVDRPTTVSTDIVSS